MGCFSYTRADVTVGKRDADQHVNDAKSFFQRTLQKMSLLERFHICYQKRLKKMSCNCSSKGSSVGKVSCQSTWTTAVWRHICWCSYTQVILLLLPIYWGTVFGVVLGWHHWRECEVQSWMCSAATACHNPTGALRCIMFSSSFIDTEDTLPFT